MLARLRSAITPPPAGGLAEAQRHLDSLTKPPGSLGRLEEIAARLAALAGGAPRVERPHIFTFAADHGVVAEGVSAYPQIVTVQMVETFLRGGAAVNVLARQAEARVIVADFGVANPIPGSPGLHSCPIAPGTANLARGPAMTRAQALQALETGARLAEQALDARAALRLAPLGRARPRRDPRAPRAHALPRPRAAPRRGDGRRALHPPGARRRAHLARDGDVQVGRRQPIGGGLDGPLRGRGKRPREGANPRERGCAGEAGARTAVRTTPGLVVAGGAAAGGENSASHRRPQA